MIVELFGPPAAGKTTFAKALEKQLRETGYNVEPVFSFRPAEVNTVGADRKSRKGVSNLCSRLMRPAASIATVMGDPKTLGRSIRLIGLNPPAKIMWRLRLTQYLMRLSYSWARASRADHVVLFDQGYVQLICALILLGSRDADDRLVDELLDAMPSSGLLVSLLASRPLLEERLRERFRSQHPLERLLELDLKTNLDFVDVIARLDEKLRQRGRQVISVSSLDSASLLDGVAAIQRNLDEITRRGQETACELSPTG